MLEVFQSLRNKRLNQSTGSSVNLPLAPYQIKATAYICPYIYSISYSHVQYASFTLEMTDLSFHWWKSDEENNHRKRRKNPWQSKPNRCNTAGRPREIVGNEDAGRVQEVGASKIDIYSEAVFIFPTVVVLILHPYKPVMKWIH